MLCLRCGQREEISERLMEDVFAGLIKNRQSKPDLYQHDTPEDTLLLARAAFESVVCNCS